MVYEASAALDNLMYIALPITLPQEEYRRASRNDQRPDPRVIPIGVECVSDNAQSRDDEENRGERIERDGPWAWGFRHCTAKDDQRDPGQREEYPVGEDCVLNQLVVPLRDGEERGQYALQQYRRRRRMKARTEFAERFEETAVSAHCIIDPRRGEQSQIHEAESRDDYQKSDRLRSERPGQLRRHVCRRSLGGRQRRRRERVNVSHVRCHVNRD